MHRMLFTYQMSRPAGDPPMFAVTGQIGARLDAAAARGHALMRTWLDEHPGAGREAMVQYIRSFVPAVPGDDVRVSERAELAEIRATSTPDRERAASWYAEAGFPYVGDDPRPSWWSDRAHALGGARSAVELLRTTLDLAQDVWYPAQRAAHEARPFTEHQKAPDGGWPAWAFTSHPSGHATATYAAAFALAQVDEAHAAQYLEMGRRVAYSRLFQQMHWPHDVVAGAMLGAMAGTAAAAAAAVVEAAAVARVAA